MKIDAELSQQLAQLRQQFADGLPRRMDAIDAALGACRADPSNDTALQALVTVLHTLGGAAGIFGFSQLGKDVRDTERMVSDWIESGESDHDRLHALAVRIAGWREQSTLPTQD